MPNVRHGQGRSRHALETRVRTLVRAGQAC